ncbi:uncharacterized protein LOC18447574 [Amborella trichopoda]|nr:uncharacterized protein LOC18447574 [Amborella trichopoda]|eukprot:XP_006857730.2 uncharacterized protein LOC18447574 [Amborella trichopoda]
MLGQATMGRSSGFNPDALGHNAMTIITNLCFTVFVVSVLIFTIIAATYQPEDPLFHPSTKITTFLTSKSNATFRSDDSVLRTGEDFVSANQSTFLTFINITDIFPASNVTTVVSEPIEECSNSIRDPIDCTDPEIFHLMMRLAIETFNDIHFYRFGKPVRGPNLTTCDMAWRFRPKEGKAAAFYKDYRSFVVSRSENCTFRVASIGDYHSGVYARKKQKGKPGGFGPKAKAVQAESPILLPVLGEAVNDSVPVIESESGFSSGKYLLYNGGGDRCKSMNHFLWSFLCSLGEAQYLNRTLVMDLKLCLSSIYTSSRKDEEGKDFRFYFDFEHLRESASVLDQNQFWSDWGKWHKKDKLSLYLIDDIKVTPMQLADIQNTLIMRKFGAVEPDNYWYRVCEGETESVIQRPWHTIWKSRRLMEIVSAISARLNWDFDSVHVVRGEKARNTELWPNLAKDTSPESLLSTLKDKIDAGRNLYIATNEPDTSFFNPLNDRYTTHFLNDYSDLWNENSEWYKETKELNYGVPVAFDGYMRGEVDTEVFLRGKKQIETFNELTRDCKDGINTCSS